MTGPRTYSEIFEALSGCVGDGVIYNVDFNAWKHRATHLLEKDIRGVDDVLYYNASNPTENDKELHWALVSVSIATFPSKKVLKLIEVEETEYSGGIRRVVSDWKPVADLFRTVKPMIQKGRKPSTNPRKTPERTLNNTGTCGCCGSNVKMHGGVLVDHGFDIQFGFRNGKCPGVGFEPIETSPAILNHMMVLISTNLESLKGQIDYHTNSNQPVPSGRRVSPNHNGFVNPGEDNYERAKRMFLSKMESDIRYMNKQLEEYKTRLNSWEPRSLPGSSS